MKRLLLIALPSFLLGAVFGAAFWYLASPLWIDRVVSESLVTGAGVTVLAEGQFRDADAAHRGTGTARLVTLPGGRVEVQLSAFEVTNGPDLELWLSDAADPQSAADVTSGKWVSLGLLKGNIGDQSYTVPPSIDPASFNSVVVWCEQFGVLFSPAPLAAPGG